MSLSIVATSFMVGVTSSLLINPVVGDTIHNISGIQHLDNIEHRDVVNLRHTEYDRGDDKQTLEFEDEDEDKEAYHRQLEESAAQTFASFTPEKIMRAMPLELRINEEGTAFVEGPYGYLEPYAESFAKGGQQGGDTYWDQLLNVDNIMHEADIVHVKSIHRAPPPSDRLYYKILKEDGIDVNMMRNNHGLRGRRRAMRDIDLKEDYNHGVIHLDSINFRSPEEILDKEVSEDPQDGRALQDITPHHKTSVAAQDPQEEEEEEEEEGSYYHNMTPHNNRQKSTYKKKVPDIRRVRPKQGTVVSNTYTFSAKVSPAQATKSPVKSVVFQLQRQDGTKSDSIDMKPIGGGIYEATVDGFNKHRGTQWCYQISVKDERSKKRRTGCTSFSVAGVGDSGSHFVNDDKEVEKAPPAPTPTGGVKLMSRTKEVSDSNWNHGGYIAGAVGRILFKFKETGDQVFVCSGTVVKDGRDSDTSDTSDGRTIIATAAHCCYSDIYKEFASEAMFIPDQDSTKGDKSDHNCRNDRYGCWATSWAVVSEGWTKGTFPINVPHDYAFYVIENHLSNHQAGYEPGSYILEERVSPMKIDFEHGLDREFIYSIGYSADEDPSLRHCAERNTVINGIPSYTNFWLNQCAMTGGASGGAWIKDMDETGKGTLISLNSWGFSHKVGMAGPNLQTKSGSCAQTLFNKARRSSNPGTRVKGYIVTTCED